MAMASMKLTADQKRSETAMCAPGSIDAPDYPWGLRIHLEGPQLEALGLGLLKPGTKVMIVGEAEVKSASLDEGEDQKTRKSMSLQICDMQCTPDAGAAPTLDGLYPSMKAEG